MDADVRRDIEIRPFTAFSPLLTDAVRVYVETWLRDLRTSHDFIARYAHFPDFRGYVAVDLAAGVVGMGFGTASLPGQWWHDRVAGALGDGHPALQDAWVLTELAVLPGYRSRGIGGLLHDALVAAQPHRHLLLSTQVDNLGARRFYERRGWRYLHSGLTFRADEPPYVVMGNVIG